jgi:hypothetical protein
MNELTQRDLESHLKSSFNSCEEGHTDSNGDETIFFNDLVTFVENHTYTMLVALYLHIQEQETRLQKLMEPNSDLAEKAEDVEIWMKELLKNPDSKPLRLFGPVGERPIHVCALSAYRFEGVDFKGQGNYMKKGILQGIRKYLEGADGGRKDEMYAEYGKDYCALLGTYINGIRAKSGKWAKATWTVSKMKPPFWKTVKRWHTKNFDSKSSTEQMKQSVTVGLYEGETIMCPLIATGDVDNLNWVLDLESEKDEVDKQKSVNAQKDPRSYRFCFSKHSTC